MHAQNHMPPKRMTKINALVLAGLLTLPLTACQPKGLSLADVPESAPVTVQTVDGCDAHVQKPWVVGSATHTVDATTSGPTCAQAVVALSIRSPDGTPELAWSSRTQDLFGLADATDAATMEAALNDWIDQSNSMFVTSSALPAWADGKDAPTSQSEEFPFHPEAWFDRQAWEQMRKDNAPLFVFPQGRESQAVFMLRDGQLEPVGVQQFPG